MKLSRLIFAATVAAAGLSAIPAYAANRTTVSGTGVDSGTCGIAAPCRTLQYALSQTNPGGQVLVLDSAGYGAVTITQAVTIINEAHIAILNATSGSAVTVNAGPTDVVILRGVYIDGLGTGSTGVQVNSAGTFSISGSTITNFTGVGINMVPSAGNTNLQVTNSSIYANGGGNIYIKPTGGAQVRAALSGNTLSGGSNPSVVADGSGGSSGLVHVLLNGGVIRNISGNAVVANAQSGEGAVRVQLNGTAMFSVTNALVANGSNAQVSLNQTSISNVGVVSTTTGGGLINSFNNNGIYFYTTLGTLTSIPVK